MWGTSWVMYGAREENSSVSIDDESLSVIGNTPFCKLNNTHNQHHHYPHQNNPLNNNISHFSFFLSFSEREYIIYGCGSCVEGKQWVPTLQANIRDREVTFFISLKRKKE